MGIREGMKVVHLKHPQRGEAIVKKIIEEAVTLWYPQFNFTVQGVRVRDLEVK